MASRLCSATPSGQLKREQQQLGRTQVLRMTISNIRLPTATSSQAASGYTGEEFTQGGGSPGAHRKPIRSARMHTSGRGATTLSNGGVSRRDTQWLSNAVVTQILPAITFPACLSSCQTICACCQRTTHVVASYTSYYQRYGKHTIH